MMAKSILSSANSSHPKRWMLWVDGCGGFAVSTGSSWSLGRWIPPRQIGSTDVRGMAANAKADIQATASWPTWAGNIRRDQSEYFWQGAGETEPRWLSQEDVLVPGDSGRVFFRRPSPLSPSAVLTMEAPNRFADHVDHWILADQTVLIGAGKDNHVRVSSLEGRVVLVNQGDVWRIKIGSEQAVLLSRGERFSRDSLSIVLEEN